MSRQIIKQPNGKYCIFSSIVDNVISYDMTAEDIINEWVDEEREKIQLKVNDVISKLENHEKPYHQFTKNYDEMLECIKENYGKKEVDKIKLLIEN